MFIPGNILFLLTADVRSTNGTGSVSVAYDSSSFVMLSSFTQLNYSHILLCDRGKFCLHILDRASETVRTYAGICAIKGLANGPLLEAKFSFPLQIVKGERATSHLVFAIDQDINAIRYIDSQSNMVGTVTKSANKLLNMKDIVFETDTDDKILVFAINYIKRVSIYGGTDTPPVTLFSSESSDDSDGTFEEASLLDPKSAIAIGSGVYLVSGKSLRVVNTRANTVSSICEEGTFQPGPIDTCQLPMSVGLSLVDNTVYIATHQRIASLKGE